ncbi:putative rhomboid family protein [Legionella quinlivanii]|uniref:Putative rhomboid family protein n=1 Tax=Legionella quinlivanii TaxID=45073 RepID=A0A0W0Y3J7_9GAMM|nr:rhomboid family intramembrane serine protease [Legionella quinlivanii]KTD51639.1 putative rhomboid family protein [Legionella quinlivanii]SEF61587.1 Membrane associated serine protease, rhomboid family [Legionella quinlivanii DSM 21216]STY10834.1 putative rhomboid family protein [Legionella quinlivanii]
MLDNLNESLLLIVNQTKANLNILLIILLVLWSVFFINILLGKRLFYLGIFPRKIIGLPGIICAPFLHANFNHLFFNSIPLIVLSNFLLINGLEYFLMVTVAITIISGFLIWAFAKPGLHIGASAVITGYWSLLVSNIAEQGGLTAIILGIISLYYFAGIFLGVFPGKKGVSWEGHLFGLIAGIIVSFWLTDILRGLQALL